MRHLPSACKQSDHDPLYDLRISVYKTMGLNNNNNVLYHMIIITTITTTTHTRVLKCGKVLLLAFGRY